MRFLNNICFLRRGLVGLFCFMAYGAVQAAEYSGKCPNNAPAREARYCRFFLQFNTDNKAPLDVRIADALQVKSATETRSIGLIIAIDKYPNLPNHDISAAKVDGDRLKEFLINKQKFDEVIVLRNEDATVDNINYFLDDYLPNRALDFKKKARLLVAYSGHGRSGGANGIGGPQAAFVLSAANDVNGAANMYKMQNFATSVETLANRYFHVLTLVNACYGGSFFTNGTPGGNPDAFEKPGSYALTAGSDNEIVLALDREKGSLFFDLILAGITQGTADPLYWDAYSAVGRNGKNVLQSGLTRTNALSTFLTSSYIRVARQRSKSIPGFALSDPWIGPAQKGIAFGGFFFLSDRSSDSSMAGADTYNRSRPASINSPRSGQSFGLPGGGQKSVSPNSEGGSSQPSTSPTSSAAQNAPPFSEPLTSEQLSLPPGPVSSIPGRPDIKIFKAPEIYPIHGYDLSSAEGKIEWTEFENSFAELREPRFIYARALQWSGPDATFTNRWLNVKALNTKRMNAGKLGLDYGAYVKYDFCSSPSDQMAKISEIVPIDSNSLPLAIELVHPYREDKRQLICLNAMGVEKAKLNILELATNVHMHFGKIPLLYGNRNNLATLTDERSDKFMVWLGSYGAKGIQLRGRNPWTLWQYSGTLNVKGFGPKTTGEVFFGTEEQYQHFKNGQSNIGLNAVN
jgi:GH25 family lysozyme M1 (1,4-beta-N-acetylmuramidase)